MAQKHHERDEADGVESGLLYEFADGELSDAEQRAVLLRLDGDPGGWRRLALAFVETQRWRRELRGVVGDAPLGVARGLGRGQGRDVIARAPLTPCPSPQGAGGKSAGAAKGRVRLGGSLALPVVRSVVGAVVTMAVGILVGFVIGRPERVARPDVGARATVAAQGPIRSEADVAPRAPVAESYRVAQVGFTDPVSGELQQVEAAVLGPPGSPVLRLTTPVSELPEGLRDLLDQAALEVVTTQRVYPLQLETGRRVMLVGDDGAEVRMPSPVRRAVY